MKTSAYLSLVHTAYQNRGGISGQREKLRTTSAIRIRKRMVDDILNGAVLPPVVVGVVLQESDFSRVKTLERDPLLKLVGATTDSRISIIDGMQRTSALQEAMEEDSAVGLRLMRVEFWISNSTNSLIYRMLVLNTGQVPWNLRNQVEIVFQSLILEIQEDVKNLEVLEVGDNSRRSKGGQFQANELVELFLVFGARKEKIDIRERLADEFTRLDFVEAAADKAFAKHFCSALDVLVRLDLIFDKAKKAREKASASPTTEKSGRPRFVSGKDLFASQPACVGLVTAIAFDVFGRPGVVKASAEQVKKFAKIETGLKKFEKRFHNKSSDEIETFLDFQILNEVIIKGRPGLSVGDTEREFFLKSFQVLLEEEFDVGTMAPCWRAY